MIEYSPNANLLLLLVGCSEQQLRSSAHKYRVRLDPITLINKSWAGSLGMLARVVDTAYGEYSGPVGWLQNEIAPDPSPEQLRRRHPNWSEERLARVHKERRRRANKGTSPDVSVRYEQQLRRYLGFLRELVQYGAVWLIVGHVSDESFRPTGTVRRAVGELSDEDLVKLPDSVLLQVVP